MNNVDHDADERRTRFNIPFSIQIAVVSFLIVAVLAPATFSDDDPRTQRELFETHVRPTLVQHCIKCHGSAKQEGGLKLTSLESLTKGGESGASIVPGNPEDSLLLEALRYESIEMPPDGRLDQKTILGIEQWIKTGAKWPQGLVLKPTSTITKADRDWWCYQPLKKPKLPDVENEKWCRNEIDLFVLARLQQEKIVPALTASNQKLFRRVHFALTGLPPEAESESDRDRSLDSLDGEWYAELVDRLLESPAYGENQARFWLDLVRYADSDGYNADHARPDAFRYRDYVIRSFNIDKPYDRFVLEQLAGDELFPGNGDALTATMYLRHWIYEWNQRDVEGQWNQILNDVTETTADVFLAQGLKCARCHDHKFDPLLQHDYYALRSFFAALQPREDLPIADVPTQIKYNQKLEQWEKATHEIRQRLHEIETPVLLKNATREGFDKFTKEIQSMIAKRIKDRSAYEHQIASLASNQFDLHPEKLSEWLDKETETERQQLLKKLAKFNHLKPDPLPTMKFVVSDVGADAPPTFIPDTDSNKPVSPGYPKVLANSPALIQPPHGSLNSTGRRTALARWIASPKNPLTARVIVNRVWQQHFGRGLVPTSSDFGHLGTPPSHPELLDWLACRFIDDGWSLKKLHRLILNSATYRQASDRSLDSRLAQLDPQNTLLWKMSPRRLSGEEIHDTLLSASGELKRQKRAIYKEVKRNKLDPLLAAFDFPDRVESQGTRHRTTTSPQALLLMNNPWFHDRARNMSTSLKEANRTELIRQAYQRLYFRQPTEEELQHAIKFLEDYQAITPRPPKISRMAKFIGSEEGLNLTTQTPVTVTAPPLKTSTDRSESGDFTIEANVMLKSLYPDASVRTIVASWSNKHTERGWSLGVTSTKSAFKPRNLILQLVGTRTKENPKPQYEVVASNLRLELNKPYYVAVSIDVEDASANGITFYLKDLSSPNSKLQVANLKHKARWNVHPDRSIEIGGRSNRHLWDGVIQSVRIHPVAVDRSELTGSLTRLKKQLPRERLLFDVRFSDLANLGKDASGNGRHARVQFGDSQTITPQETARTALLHALLCSSEAIYVD